MERGDVSLGKTFLTRYKPHICPSLIVTDISPGVLQQKIDFQVINKELNQENADRRCRALQVLGMLLSVSEY